MKEDKRFLESFGHCHHQVKVYCYLLVRECWTRFLSFIKNYAGWFVIFVPIAIPLIIHFIYKDPIKDIFTQKEITLIAGYGVIFSLILSNFKEESTKPTLRLKVDNTLTEKGIVTTEKLDYSIKNEHKNDKIEYNKYPSIYYRLKVENLSPNSAAKNSIANLISVKKLCRDGNNEYEKGEELQLKVIWRKETQDSINITRYHSFPICAFIPNNQGYYKFSIREFWGGTPTRLDELYNDPKPGDIFVLKYFVTADNGKSNELDVAIRFNKFPYLPYQGITHQKMYNKIKSQNNFINIKQVLPCTKDKEIRDLFKQFNNNKTIEYSNSK